MTAAVTADLLACLGAAQSHVDALVVTASDEGYEVEIHAQIADAGLRYSIALVRRIYAPEPIPPTLKVI